MAVLIRRKDLGVSDLESEFWFIARLSLAPAGSSTLLSGWWVRLNNPLELALVITVLSIRIPVERLTFHVRSQPRPVVVSFDDAFQDFITAAYLF